MFYDKKIKYLDYYERGERIKGCGFAKIEVRDEELRIELTVSGLYPTDSYAREVMLCSEKQEKHLAQFEFHQGRGELKRVYHRRSDIGGTGIPYWELCGICIHLGGEREISCRWQKSENKAAEMLLKKGAEHSLHAAAAPMAVPITEPIEAPLAQQDGRAEKTASNMPAKLMWIERERMPEDERAPGEETERERAVRRETVGREAAAREPAKEERRHSRMLDDKWLQLCAIYPHVQPFRDERDYLSIKPADFLLFPANAYRQVNNSFLLHGYYNYKHLLLSRIERKGEILYYIGVPGNYYEKEKQVALMFGFESFECAEEPAEDGDFGYYMMRMEL